MVSLILATLLGSPAHAQAVQDELMKRVRTCVKNAGDLPRERIDCYADGAKTMDPFVRAFYANDPSGYESFKERFMAKCDEQVRASGEAGDARDLVGVRCYYLSVIQRLGW